MNGSGDSGADNENESSTISSQSGATSSAPKEFVDQEQDWFTPGRYLKIWAETGKDTDHEIHEKEFILLDSKNTEGNGVRIDTRTTVASGSSRNMIVLLGPDHARRPGSTDQIFLEETGPGDKVPKDRYVRLDHTYNIPFAKYKCEDLGILEEDSLDLLRLRYVLYLMKEWRLTDQVKASFEKDTASVSSTASSMRNFSGGQRGKG